MATDTFCQISVVRYTLIAVSMSYKIVIKFLYITKSTKSHIFSLLLFKLFFYLKKKKMQNPQPNEQRDQDNNVIVNPNLQLPIGNGKFHTRTHINVHVIFENQHI